MKVYAVINVWHDYMFGGCEVSVVSHERTLHWSKASVKSHKSYSSLERG